MRATICTKYGPPDVLQLRLELVRSLGASKVIDYGGLYLLASFKGKQIVVTMNAGGGVK